MYKNIKHLRLINHKLKQLSFQGNFDCPFLELKLLKMDGVLFRG